MEGFACLEKQEKLALPNIKTKEFILTDLSPFPGYYSVTPGENSDKPQYVFIILKQGEGCYEDMVLRASCKLKKDIDFHANYCRLSILNKKVPAIRLKVNNLMDLPEILDKLKETGMTFESRTDVKPFESIIKIRKYVDLKEITAGVYSGQDADHYYLQVSAKAKWEDFYKMVQSVRGSGDYNSFDAAQLSLYRKNDIVEFIRIYTKSFNKEDFVKMREAFEKQTQRFVK